MAEVLLCMFFIVSLNSDGISVKIHLMKLFLFIKQDLAIRAETNIPNIRSK